MRPRTALLVVLLSAAAAFALGWLSKAKPAPDGPGSAADGVAPEASASEARAEADAALLASAREELAGEKERRRRLEQERNHLLAELAARKANGSGDGPEEAAGSHEPRYRFEAFAQPLASIDWTKSGEAVRNLAAIMSEIIREVRKGNNARTFMGKAARWNGPLVTVAVTAQNGGVPGTGPNGSFSHPSVIANLVHATLLEAGHPLDAAQEKRLGELARQHVEADAQRLAGYTEETFALEKTIDEAELRDRFMADVDALLTAVQREILHPEAGRGRLQLDLFSSGIIWATIGDGVRYGTRDELVEGLAQGAMRDLGLTGEERTAVVEAAREWGASFSPEYIETKPDALSRSGFLPVEHVKTAARMQLAFYKSVSDRLGSEHVAKLRAETRVLIPFRRP